ncbi:hypothetical protein PR048_003937 [Dryococelus australis]|uniref:Uncharacterized protein n=1 Tax=Dryococelus australis TaxID=614101 RepID=A0ABQ9I421_9NEOP|nr:hypothetical protein PR048_003937 [Dryococelus australis]
MLKYTFENNDFLVKHAESDADSLIISTAIETAARAATCVQTVVIETAATGLQTVVTETAATCVQTVVIETAATGVQTVVIETSATCVQTVVIGEYVVLIVLLTSDAPLDHEIFFIKRGRGTVTSRTFSSYSLRSTGSLGKYVIFLHAFIGCDTTSTVSGIGEKQLSPFHLIQKGIALGNKRLSSLPPTEDSAQQHSFRAYSLVQLWHGNKKPSELWDGEGQQMVFYQFHFHFRLHRIIS